MNAFTFHDNPELHFEISELADLDGFIKYVESKYKGWRFDRTEKRYQTCIVAIFIR